MTCSRRSCRGTGFSHACRSDGPRTRGSAGAFRQVMGYLPGAAPTILPPDATPIPPPAAMTAPTHPATTAPAHLATTTTVRPAMMARVPGLVRCRRTPAPRPRDLVSRPLGLMLRIQVPACPVHTRARRPGTPAPRLAGTALRPHGPVFRIRDPARRPRTPAPLPRGPAPLPRGLGFRIPGSGSPASHTNAPAPRGPASLPRGPAARARTVCRARVKATGRGRSCGFRFRGRSSRWCGLCAGRSGLRSGR